MCFISPGRKWGLEKNLLAVLRFYSWIIGTMDPGWGRMAVLLCLVMTASLTSGKSGIKERERHLLLYKFVVCFFWCLSIAFTIGVLALVN